MREKEKEVFELGIEAKYIGRTEKKFLSTITYAECLYILTPENEFCNKIRKLSLQKLSEIIEKLQKENEKLKRDNGEYELILDIWDNRTYRKKYLEERRAEQPNLLYPDGDEIYERYYELKEENEKLKKSRKI